MPANGTICYLNVMQRVAKHLARFAELVTRARCFVTRCMTFVLRLTLPQIKVQTSISISFIFSIKVLGSI
jgi:hypothetical protein